MRILTVNTILMLVFLVQNVATNYIHTWLYAKSVRGVEKELREALIVKLQQLSITYHKENAVRKASVQNYEGCGTGSDTGVSDFYLFDYDYFEYCSVIWGGYL